MSFVVTRVGVLPKENGIEFLTLVIHIQSQVTHHYIQKILPTRETTVLTLLLTESIVLNHH